MQKSGTIMVHTYTSRAQLPVAGATVVISRQVDGGRHKLLAIRVTNENGEIAPISVAVPQSGDPPFSVLDIWVEHPGYLLELIRDVQVFSGVDSVQNVALMPLAEHAIPRNSFHISTIVPQAL